MAANGGVSDIYEFEAGEVGASAAAALRATLNYAENFSTGRYFAEIASLRHQSEEAGAEFERAALAELIGDAPATEFHIHQGMQATARLKTIVGLDSAVNLPHFLRRIS